MEKYGSIYKITNKISGKVYIGKTTQSISDRFLDHQKKSSKCYYIAAAIKKYGVVNFSIEEIYSAQTKHELSQKEKEFITQYNSLVPTGYNIMFGDTFTKTSNQHKALQKAATENSGWANVKPLVAYNVYTGKTFYFPRVVDAISKTGLTKSIIEKNISNSRVSKGFIFSYANQNGSGVSNISSHVQRLGIETEQSEQKIPTSVRVPRLYQFSEKEKEIIIALYETRSAKEVANQVGLELSRCKKLLRKWGVMRSLSEGLKFRDSRRNMR